jgi:hypothetical protein
VREREKNKQQCENECKKVEKIKIKILKETFENLFFID